MKNALIVARPERQQSDPRIELEPETLALAKRNAFPLVAQQSRARTAWASRSAAAARCCSASRPSLACPVAARCSRARGCRRPSPAAGQAGTAGVAVPPEALTQVRSRRRGAPVADAGPVPPIVGDRRCLRQHRARLADAQPSRRARADRRQQRTRRPVPAALVAPGVAGNDAFASLRQSDVAKATRMKNPGPDRLAGHADPGGARNRDQQRPAGLRPRRRQQRHSQLRRQPRARPALVAPDRPVQERRRRRADPRLRHVDAADPSRRSLRRACFAGGRMRRGRRA